MRDAPEKVGVRRRMGSSWPLVGSILVALLAVWTLGSLHSAEHDVRQHGASCAACIAVASDGLVDTAVPFPRTAPCDERPLSSPNDGAGFFGQIACVSARAPPPRRG